MIRSRLLLALLLATPALAQVHPNLERGVNADKMYQFGGLDSVNLFNGNLSISIPIGGTLPVSQHLSYGLTLTYNSKVWENWQWRDPNDPNQPPVYEKRPSRRCNAGLGWLITLGWLISPDENDINDKDVWRYVSPDGSDHVFYDKLHDSDAATAAQYTRDGTYLRLTSNGADKVIEFPDGTEQQFQAYQDGLVQRWRLIQTRDRFLNHYDIDYSVADQWNITDQHGRATVVHFSARSSAEVGYSRVISSIAVPAFDGTTATYTFAYHNAADEDADVPVRRGLCGGDADITGHDPSPSLPLLTGIDLPDGSQFIPTYNTDPIPTCHSGEIATLTLPTFGQIVWTYTGYELPVKGCESEPVNDSSGVHTRTFRDMSGGGGQQMAWTYTPALTEEPQQTWQCPGDPVYGTPPSEEVTNTVTGPSGDESVYYFSVWPGLRNNEPRPDGSTRMEYGLPFSRKQTASNSKYLSSKIFAGTAAAGTPKRSTYVKYDRDWWITYDSGGQVLADGQFDLNRRLVGNRTIFHDDGDNTQDTDYESFDGVGHYRSVTRDSSFHGSSTAARVSTTNYNVADATVNAGASVLATGTYTRSSNGGSFVLPAVGAPWVLNLYSTVVTSEGTASAIRHYCFEPSNGFLNGSRVLVGATPGNTDLVSVSSSDPALTGGSVGNVTRETFYGGDKAPLTSTETTLCGLLTAPGPLGYDIRHSYSSGVLAATQYYGNGTALSFMSLDQTIDVNTGLVKSSRDTAGVETTYTYDSSRRLKTVTTPATASISHVYTNATSSSPFKITSTQTSSAGMIKAETQLDFLGRIWRESTLMPGNTWSTRVHHYDSAGRQDWVSVPQSSGSQPPTNSFNPSNKTVSSDFDAFGRPGTITAPDTNTTTISYTGIRQIDRTVRVGTIDSTTREIYDGFGRLFQVKEPGASGSPDTPNSTTTYTYDLADRLVKSEMDKGTTPHQVRSFSYDNRGFLTQEVHPELERTSPAESGTTSYSNFDARGHAEYRKVNESEDIFDLQYVYDAAERLIQVNSRNPDDHTKYRTSKEFHFGTSASKNGKLDYAVRHNYVPGLGEVLVTGTYEYGDGAGRLTKTTTQIRTKDVTPDPLAQTLEQSYSYDDLGQTTGITYPGQTGCVPGPCGVNDSRASVSLGYEAGRLHQVTDFVTAIGYMPSGTPSSIAHANGMFDSIIADSMSRPSTISFAGTSPCTPPSISASDTSAPYGSSATLSATTGPESTPPFAYQLTVPPI